MQAARAGAATAREVQNSLARALERALELSILDEASQPRHTARQQLDRIDATRFSANQSGTPLDRGQVAATLHDLGWPRS
jgi:hypothetical protein